MKTIMKIVNEAYTTVPFYVYLKEKKCVEISDDMDWEDVPIICKDDLIGQTDKTVAAGYIMDVIYNKNIVEYFTSENDGKCFNTLWNVNEQKKALLPIWLYRKKYYNVLPNDRMCFFYDGNIDGEIEENGFKYRIGDKGIGISKVGLSDENIMRIYELIKQFQVEWIQVKPSICMLLARFIESNKLGVIKGLKYIELVLENVSHEEENYIKEVFGCDVAVHFLLWETNAIAYECPDGNLHILDGNVFVEIINNENGSNIGDICVTSLQNSVTPIIRYNTKLNGYIEYDVKCNCGNKRPVLRICQKENADWLNANGYIINPSEFTSVIEGINRLFDNCILYYRIVQCEENIVICRIVLCEPYKNNENIKKEIKDTFVYMFDEGLLVGVTIRFEFVDKIEDAGLVFCKNLLNKD